MDSSRGAFVKENYRYSTAEDTVTKTNFNGARTLEIDTTLSTQAQAVAAAAELLAFYKTPALILNVVVEGVDVADTSAFDGSPAVFDVEFDDFGTIAGGQAMLASSVAINYQEMTTALTLRG